MSGFGKPWTLDDVHRKFGVEALVDTPRHSEWPAVPVVKKRTPSYNPVVVTAFFKEHGVPPPEYEYRFHPTRRWRMDVAWPEEKVAIEVQGGIWNRGAHGRGSGIVRDYEKHNAAMVAGWRVVYVVPDDLCMSATAGMVKQLLNSGKAG